MPTATRSRATPFRTRRLSASAGKRWRATSIAIGSSCKAFSAIVPISNFAYPYGDISFATKRYLGARYNSCRATTPGVNADVADLSVLKSNALEQSSIGRQGVSHLITETVRRNGWLLFASHDVNDTPSQYGVRPELLTFALRSALAAGCRLVTVAHALRILRGEEPDGEAA